MSRPDYHRATRDAYRTLLAAKICTLPVDVSEICARCHDTKLVSLSEADRLMNYDRNFDPFGDGPSRTALTVRRWHEGHACHTILWNDNELSPKSGAFRFAIAHELAHVILRHEGGQSTTSELEANLFALHLLCPRPVLDVLCPRSAMEISYLCGVPYGTAREAWEGLQQENRYVDLDVWKQIFTAFELDEKRSVDDFISPVTRLAMDIRSRRRAYA